MGLVKYYYEVKVAQSCLTLCDSMGCSPWNSSGQNTGVGSLFLLQGVFPIQGLNLGLPHCSQILYQLSHKGNPRILEWVAYPFSSGSSPPRSQTRVSCIVGRLRIDLTEAEEINNRWQEYTKELYKKGLNDPDNSDGMVTLLEPDILECEVKWLYEAIL